MKSGPVAIEALTVAPPGVKIHQKWGFPLAPTASNGLQHRSAGAARCLRLIFVLRDRPEVRLRLSTDPQSSSVAAGWRRQAAGFEPNAQATPYGSFTMP
jgi:hypothetical protein